MLKRISLLQTQLPYCDTTQFTQSMLLCLERKKHRKSETLVKSNGQTLLFFCLPLVEGGFRDPEGSGLLLLLTMMDDVGPTDSPLEEELGRLELVFLTSFYV
eukprot:gb/GECG01012778.1/.p1 GENE.gb/GECG01012778.1/~~gb/GECG01012778.1/.p1  ORF type:complete len:102 (+),score=14.84 gb/GECG01012778.1/:1-306(+)